MSDWSPYALERYRVAGGARGTKRLVAVLAALAVVWLAANLLSDDGQVSVGIGGQQGSVGLVPPEAEGPPKATVTIQPGRVAVLEQPLDTDGSEAQDSRLVTGDRAYPILGWLLVYGPIALVPWLARKLLTRPATTEVNFGVYKGAMPYEMISSHRAVVYPRAAVEEPLFGRGRGDYVEDE